MNPYYIEYTKLMTRVNSLMLADAALGACLVMAYVAVRRYLPPLAEAAKIAAPFLWLAVVVLFALGGAK